MIAAIRIACVMGLICLFAGVASAQNDNWSVSAANWFQYWYYQDSTDTYIDAPYRSQKEDSVDNRFMVDFNFGDFYAGAWLRIFEPHRPDSSYERFAQRYFGWHDGNFTLHAGNFYQTFDRGLTLNAFLDDAIYFDNNLDGFKASALFNRLEFDAFSARAQRFRSNDRIYTLRGIHGAIRPLMPLKLGASYVRFKQNDIISPDYIRNTNVTGYSAQFSSEYLDLYGEYATRDGLNDFGAQVSGDGTYLSGSVNLGFANLYSEYKNYINLLYPDIQGSINVPPPVSHEGRTLASLAGTNGECGFLLGTLLSPTNYLNIDLSFSESNSRDHLFYLAEKYAGLRYQFEGITSFNFHWVRFDLTGEDEAQTYLDAYYYVNPVNTISFIAYGKKFMPIDAESYHENYLILGYSNANLYSLSLGGSTSNKLDAFPAAVGESRRTAFIESTIHFKNHDLMIFHGVERGGFVCSSGLCQYRPSFDGTRVILFSRF